MICPLTHTPAKLLYRVVDPKVDDNSLTIECQLAEGQQISISGLGFFMLNCVYNTQLLEELTYREIMHTFISILVLWFFCTIGLGQLGGS